MHVAVWYSDDTVWHERLLVYPQTRGCWWVRTPDGDEYLEDVDCSDPDTGPSRAKLQSYKRAAPAGVAGVFYRFPYDWVGETLREIIVRGQAGVETAGGVTAGKPMEMIDADGKLVDFDVFVGAPVLPGGPGPKKKAVPKGRPKAVPANSGEGDDEGGADGVAHEDDGFVWLSLEAVAGEIKVRQEVEFGTSAVRDGDRGVHTLPSGQKIGVRRVGVEAAAAEKDEKDDEAPSIVTDARILTPLTFDEQGRRWLDYGVGTTKMRQEPLEDFPLTGDRSLGWLLRYIREHGSTPDGRQTKWATEQKIERDSVAWSVHDLAGLALELAVCYDQVDAPNLACLEVVGRLYQLTEETNGSMKIEGYDHYVGRDKSAGLRRGIALAPGLASYTTAQLGKETEIWKQRRKAREEEAALKAAKKR